MARGVRQVSGVRFQVSGFRFQGQDSYQLPWGSGQC
jgi:hypothetical protein